jgi:hypothetical protein
MISNPFEAKRLASFSSWLATVRQAVARWLSDQQVRADADLEREIARSFPEPESVPASRIGNGIGNPKGL